MGDGTVAMDGIGERLTEGLKGAEAERLASLGQRYLAHLPKRDLKQAAAAFWVECIRRQMTLLRQRGKIEEAEIESRAALKAFEATGADCTVAIGGGSVIDAAKVTRSALQNAGSIAALFLTTEAVVSDIPEEGGAAMPDMSGMM